MANKTDEIAKRLNDQVALVHKNDLAGFERAYMLSQAIVEINDILTPEYMKPIMALMGNKLGFKTDKDDGKEGYYSEVVVKRCLVEAVLTGLQPVGNQFNIIAGNMYPTKEGCGYLLDQINGLRYTITPQLPNMKVGEDGSGSAAITMVIEWTYNGVNEKKDLPVPIRVNKRMGVDAVIGKATRKARAWLLNNINKKLGKSEIADGDVTDVDFKVVENDTPKQSVEEKEEERLIILINATTALTSLQGYEKNIKSNKAREAFEAKKSKLMEMSNMKA